MASHHIRSHTPAVSLTLLPTNVAPAQAKRARLELECPAAAVAGAAPLPPGGLGALEGTRLALLEQQNESLRLENLRLRRTLQKWATQGLVPVDEALLFLTSQGA